MDGAGDCSRAKGRLASSRSLLILRSWFWNADAEECGRRLSMPLALLCLLVAGFAAAFPLTLARYRDAVSLAEAARWPGLGSALLEFAAKGGDFSFEGGRFVPDPKAPAELTAGAWRLLLDGGEAWTRVPPDRVLRFGRERVTLSFPGKGQILEGPTGVLAGITGASLRELAADRSSFTVFVKGFLSALATAEVPGAILATSLLMLLQTALFVLVLGAFLSLSGLRIGGREAGARRAVGFLPSLKTTAALSTGPGFVAAALGPLLPGPGSALAWIAFSLLLGLRVLLAYQGRFARRSGLAK